MRCHWEKVQCDLGNFVIGLGACLTLMRVFKAANCHRITELRELFLVNNVTDMNRRLFAFRISDVSTIRVEPQISVVQKLNFIKS